MDSGSVQAHLALGAAYLTLYQKCPSRLANYLRTAGDISERERRAYEEQEKAIRAEQNSTNWPLAEKSLKRANQLDPQGKLIVEYLVVLYFIWHDPFNDRNDRLDEAKAWLERLLELEPEHKYANFHCGLILNAKAHKVLPNYCRFPWRPEPDLASLRTKVGPLLEEAVRHLERALVLNPEEIGALFFLEQVRSMQAYLADPDQAARDLHKKHMEEFRKHRQASANETQDAGGGESEAITFELRPEAVEEHRKRPFPPNPWLLGAL